MGPILGGYGVTGVFCHDCPPVNRTLQYHNVALNQLEQEVRRSCNLQLVTVLGCVYLSDTTNGGREYV